MKPKPFAVLTDALDEGCGHAARRAIELNAEMGPAQSEAVALLKHKAIAEAIRQEVLSAICERFSFDDVEGS